LNLDKINKNIHAQLSEREFEITQLIYRGMTNTQIAEKNFIFITINTVKTHLKNIYLKIDANTRLQVIQRLREYMLK